MRRIITILFSILSLSLHATEPIKSIETPCTISKVTTAQAAGQEVIVASSYEGALLCYDFNGKQLWENRLSGFFNADVYCADTNADGIDEIFAANSDGALYCISPSGETLWSFRPSEVPMNAVTVIGSAGKSYVVCGGYDNNIYYLDPKGEVVMKLHSGDYSKEGGNGKGGPNKNLHVANFLRTAKRANGQEVLALHGATNSMSARGGLYLFEPLATKPYAYYTSKVATTIGDLSINAVNPTRDNTIMLGSSKSTQEGYIFEVDLDGEMLNTFSTKRLAAKASGKFGYRITQSEAVKIAGKAQRLILFGSCIILPTDENSPKSTEAISTKYAYNDVAKDSSWTKLILASEQGGGNCIHIIDLSDKRWKEAYETLEPAGNVAAIIANSDKLRGEIDRFALPKWETLVGRPVVTFMSESPNKDTKVGAIAERIHQSYPSPIFLDRGTSGGSEKPESWNRDTIENEFYRMRRDRRQKYNNEQSTILQNVAKAYQGDSKGMSMWGGHGNDPFYYSPDTQRKIMSLTGEDQQTVMIFPEMEEHGKNSVWLMDNYIYPLADHAREHNTKLYIRSKHLFWVGSIYEPQWCDLVSGRYADVFVPSMEETTDKSMELSLMGRMGIWMSGATDSWGSRCARDNASYNRLRQHAHQNLPNHFLRNMVYHISLGAQYLDNFTVDQEYMSMLWEMIAKGLLYVPKREEIVCINPVHLSVLEPNLEWLEQGNNAKWVTLYDQQSDQPWIMGRLNGSWPAAPTTQWDFSRYAAGAKERRLNFISSFNNGHVLITPPSDPTAPRGSLEEHLHPIYKGKTQEFFTDGRYYYNADKSERYSPEEYYTIVEQAIIEGAKILPLTVKGEVGWVAAQSAPKHLRLTVIDGGYINPSTKQATIIFGTAKVKSVTNLLTGESLKIDSNECRITIPCGLFLFLDVELSEEL